MKLIYCPHCSQILSLVAGEKYKRGPRKGQRRERITYCSCRKCAGKWLSDSIMAVFSKDVIVVGIDNNTWNIAVKRYDYCKTLESRIDFFFTGWIPSKPGEVIIVDTIDEVIKYPFEYNKITTSTMPVSEEVPLYQYHKDSLDL